MRAAHFNEPGSIEVVDRPDPAIASSGDAVVRVVLACVCGTDLWYYRGQSPYEPGPIGHEFIGVVEDTGDEVTGFRAGDFVIAPFIFSDGTCPHCRKGVTSSCLAGGAWGTKGTDGGQGEAVRVPFADATLVKVPGSGHSDETMASLLALSDVMCTGHHAAASAEVGPGSVVAVIGDGAVGLSAVIAARRLGAERIVVLSRNPVRQRMALSLGATEVLPERGKEANRAVLELTDGVGVDASLECVGTGEAMATAFAVARPGAVVGFVGIPHGVELPLRAIFKQNIGLRGGVAPVRRYLPELLEDVLQERINPGRVFDFETDLEGTADAYAAMDDRSAIKALLRVGTV